MEREVSRLCEEVRIAREQNSHEEAESLAFEITDRIKRSKNVMVYNFPESLQTNDERRLEDDRFRIIKEILSFCLIDCNNIYVQRVGMKVPNVPRPLRVYLNNERDVHTILKRRGLCVSGLRFKADKTPHQRKLVREAKATLQMLKERGYKNKRVKYIRGVPVVVDIPPLSSQDEASALFPVVRGR